MLYIFILYIYIYTVSILHYITHNNPNEAKGSQIIKKHILNISPDDFNTFFLTINSQPPCQLIYQR